MPKRPLETDNCPEVEVKKGAVEKSFTTTSILDETEKRLEEHAEEAKKTEIKARGARIELIEEPDKIANQPDLENKIADLRMEKEKEIEKLRMEKENEIEKLRMEKENEISDLRKENEEVMEGLRNDKENEMEELRKKNIDLEEYCHKTQYANDEMNFEVKRLQKHVAGLKKYKAKYDDLKEQKEKVREEILIEQSEVKEKIMNRIKELEDENERLVKEKEEEKERLELYKPGTPGVDVDAVIEENKRLRERKMRDRERRYKLNEKLEEYKTWNEELTGEVEWYKKGWLTYHEYAREQINKNSQCGYFLAPDSIPMPPPRSYNPLAMPAIPIPLSPIHHLSAMPPPPPPRPPHFFLPPLPRPSPRPRSFSVVSRPPSSSHQSPRPTRFFTTEMINKK